MNKKGFAGTLRVVLAVSLVMAVSFCQILPVNAAPPGGPGRPGPRPGPMPRQYHGERYYGGHSSGHFFDPLGLFATVLAIGIIASSASDKHETHETVVVENDPNQGYHRVYSTGDIVIPTALMNKAVSEAAATDATVKFAKTNEQGVKEEVIATPQKQEGNYKPVDVQYVRDGKVIKEEIRKIQIGGNE